MIFTEKNNINQKDIIILVSPWKSPRFLYFFIKKKLPAKYGCIHYSYTRNFLNSDPGSTKKNFTQLIKKITRDLNDLNKIKPRNFFLYGQSLGGLFCMIVSDKVDIKKAMLVVPGANLAESFWHGDKTRELKQEMEKNGMSLKKLRNCWREISPDNYFKRKSLRAKFYIILSVNDKTIPIDNGRKLIALMKRRNIKFEILETFLPHKYACAKESLVTNNFYRCFMEKNKENSKINRTQYKWFRDFSSVMLSDK